MPIAFIFHSILPNWGGGGGGSSSIFPSKTKNTENLKFLPRELVLIWNLVSEIECPPFKLCLQNSDGFKDK